MREFSPKFINAMGIVLTLIGVSGVVGRLSGVWLFTMVGNTFELAPTPAPFDHVSHNSSEHVRVACEGADGKLTNAEWDWRMRSAMPGPHRRGVTLLHYFSMVREAHKRGESEPLVALTRYYFCENGDLARAAGCAFPPTAMVFDDVYVRGPAGEDALRIKCSP